MIKIGFEQDINALFENKDKEKALDRIKCILRIYSLWIASPHKSDVDIFDLINCGLSDCYSFKSLLIDYKFVTKLQKIADCECEENECYIFKRYHRDRTKENLSQLFFVQSPNTESEQIFAQQTLDTVHSFIHHSIRINMNKFEQKEQNEQVIEDEMVKQIKKEIAVQRRRANGQRLTANANDESNKFVTTTSYKFDNDASAIMDDYVSCFMENVLNDLKRHKLSANAVDALNDKLLNFEQYETDSFIMDLGEKKHSNIINMIQSLMPLQKEKNLAIKRCKENILMLNNIKNTYSASFRFFYWPFYRNNTDRINVVYKVSNAVVTEGNDGYKLCDWYILAIYGSFKEEMLQNNKASFNIMQWNGTKIKAIKKYEAWKDDPSWKLICGFAYFDENGIDKYLKLGNKWHRLYGIAKYAVITIQHLMALLFYTNFSHQQYEFTATFRRIYYNETDESLKRRHSQFHFWGKLLRETVECFGTEMSRVPERVFYHGINQEMLFESTYFHGLYFFVSFLFCIQCSLWTNEYNRRLCCCFAICRTRNGH